MAAIQRRAGKAPNVAFIRPEVKALLPQYQVIRDCIAGETVVKKERETYLPKPNAHDTSPENATRYEAYLKRAVFYNVTRRTLAGLVGQVFSRPPAVEIPDVLKPMAANVTGTGISLDQSAMLSLGNVVAYSRGGVFVDFTNTGAAGASRDQIESGEVRPTIYAYSPFEIINWRVKEVGSKEVLSLVVLLESYPVSDDGFEVKLSPQFRVLKLNDANVYVQEIWRDPTNPVWDERKFPTGNFKLHQPITPTGADGQPLKEIPFHFIGSQNNDINPDSPNLYDIASLNLAHYRNSADYEESCYVVGQPTPVATGLTQEWVENVLKGVLAFGSRGGIPLPAGATADLLQAKPNTMLKEAMTDKVEQMRSLGAKLIEDSKVQRTATEASQDNATDTSVLASCANNVSAAYQWALTYAAALMGDTSSKIEYKLNTDFDITSMTPDQVRATIDFWQKGAITFEEMRADLRRYGVATVGDKDAKTAILKEQVEALDLAAEHDPAFNTPPKAGA